MYGYVFAYQLILDILWIFFWYVISLLHHEGLWVGVRVGVSAQAGTTFFLITQKASYVGFPPPPRSGSALDTDSDGLVLVMQVHHRHLLLPSPLYARV